MNYEKTTPVVSYDPDGLTDREKFRNKLKKLDDDYKAYESEQAAKSAQMPQTLGLEERPKQEIDVEKITDEIQKAHQGEHDAKVDEIKSSSNAKTTKVDAEINDVKSDVANAVDEVNSNLAAAKTAVDNRAFDKGVYYSTIPASQKESLEVAANDEITQKTAEGERKIAALNVELGVLQTQLEADLRSFEISHALKVKEKIEKVVAEKEKANAEILKYNNTVREKEAKYQQSRQKVENKTEELEQKAREQEEKYGYSGYKKENYADRYQLALDYYGAMPHDEALKEVQNDAFVEKYLGSYYKKLLYTLGLYN